MRNFAQFTLQSLFACAYTSVDTCTMKCLRLQLPIIHKTSKWKHTVALQKCKAVHASHEKKLVFPFVVFSLVIATFYRSCCIIFINVWCNNLQQQSAQFLLFFYVGFCSSSYWQQSLRVLFPATIVLRYYRCFFCVIGVRFSKRQVTACKKILI